MPSISGPHRTPRQPAPRGDTLAGEIRRAIVEFDGRKSDLAVINSVLVLTAVFAPGATAILPDDVARDDGR